MRQVVLSRTRTFHFETVRMLRYSSHPREWTRTRLKLAALPRSPYGRTVALPRSPILAHVRSCRGDPAGRAKIRFGARAQSHCGMSGRRLAIRKTDLTGLFGMALGQGPQCQLTRR